MDAPEEGRRALAQGVGGGLMPCDLGSWVPAFPRSWLVPECHI